MDDDRFFIVYLLTASVGIAVVALIVISIVKAIIDAIW
jgi:hypothetical protein